MMLELSFVRIHNDGHLFKTQEVGRYPLPNADNNETFLYQACTTDLTGAGAGAAAGSGACS